MTDNPAIYIVYANPNDRNAYISGQYADLSEARDEAQEMARAKPGTEIHIATRTSTFVAETVVKEK